jgi:signal transduction histidine kinase
MFEELPGFDRPGKPPRIVSAMRGWGFFAIGFVFLTSLVNEPRPALHGRGLGVLLALIVAGAGMFPTTTRTTLRPGRRFYGLLAVALGSLALNALQPSGGAQAGYYFVVIVAALRLRRGPALFLSGLAVIGGCIVTALVYPNPTPRILGLALGILPWGMVIRLIRDLRLGQVEREEVIEELQESRAAQAEGAAQAERGRIARDMHDVLAHSLSALALQLEGARLLARDRGADPELVTSLERAHHLAASGLDEARRAISAMHGDEIPGPAGLRLLAEAFAEHSRAACDVRVEGTPRELSSEASLAIYRTAQEALTNVRKHAAAERVEVMLTWGTVDVTLCVSDHGAGAPVTIGAGGGYGLSGMRERAELLGGRLSAAPAEDGFRVELWLPA